MSMNLQFEWCESLASIAPSEWRRCFGRSGFYRSYDYHKAVEASAPKGVQFNYLLVRTLGAPLAIIGCFHYRLSLAVTATGIIRRIVDRIERWAPDLFTVSTFCVGQLTAVCDHLYGLDAVAVATRQAVIRESDQQIRARARELGCTLTMIKEIPLAERDFYAEAVGDRYVFVDSLPNTFLDIDPTRTYPAQIRSKYRNLYKKRTRVFRERGLRWQVVDGPITFERALEMERLYLRVLSRSDSQFERLSADFFQRICGDFEPSFALLCLDGDELVGFSVNVEDEEQVCGLYLGYDDPEHSGQVYFNLLYKVIEVARQRGKRRLQLGQTSYEVKSTLGAEPARIYLGLEGHNRLLHYLLKKFGAQLFPLHSFPERKVFAQSEQPRKRAVGG